jgi:hypothetical protein
MRILIENVGRKRLEISEVVSVDIIDITKFTRNEKGRDF